MKISKSTRMFAIQLPLMLLLTLVGYVFLGAIPGALLTGDLIAAIAQLPVITLHAFAAVGLAWFVHRQTFRDIGDDEERRLRFAIESGGPGAWPALWMLAIDFFRWMSLLCLFAWFCFPSR